MAEPTVETRTALFVGLLAFVLAVVGLHYVAAAFTGEFPPTGSHLSAVLLLCGGVVGYVAFVVAELVFHRPRIHRILFEDVRR